MTNTWKYVGAHDSVDIAGVGTVAAGVDFESDVDLAGRDDFELVAGSQLSALTVAQLRELATAAGIEHKGLKKPALIAVLTDKES